MRIQSLSPCRISLFGGGTDLDEYSSRFGGLVISLAINLRHRLTLLTEENIFEMTSNSVPYKGSLDFMHTFFSALNMGSFHHVRFISDSDALLESGLATSAAAAVSVVGAINKANNLGMSKGEIAEKAWQIEVNKVGLYGGRQDHYASTFGGFNAIIFTNSKVEVEPLQKGMIDKLYPSMVLVHTGFTREDPKIQEGFKELTPEQIEALHEIKNIAKKALKPLAEGNIEVIGALLHEAWELKKESNKGITNSKIDSIYNKAKKLGAYGGKILGAGAGGYMVFIVPPGSKERFISTLGLEHWDFSVDWNGLETRVL